MPTIDNYVNKPNQTNWLLVSEASKRVLSIVVLTDMSLGSAIDSWDPLGYRADTSIGIGDELRNLKAMGGIMTARGAALTQNMSSVPRDPSTMKRWKIGYIELLKKLQRRLGKLQQLLAKN